MEWIIIWFPVMMIFPDIAPPLKRLVLNLLFGVLVGLLMLRCIVVGIEAKRHQVQGKVVGGGTVDFFVFTFRRRLLMITINILLRQLNILVFVIWAVLFYFFGS